LNWNLQNQINTKFKRRSTLLYWLYWLYWLFKYCIGCCIGNELAM